MYEYSHGGNAAFEAENGSLIDLSANINPLGLPPTVREAVINEISSSDRYPDNFSNELRRAIGLFESVNPDWIFCGNGASDIIFRLPRAVKAAKVMVIAPTFSDYERAARSYGSEIVYHTLSDNFTLDASFLREIEYKKPNMVFICNPNNPTGQLVERNLIEEILRCCKKIGTWVVVDECFIDFTEHAEKYTCKKFLAEYPTLVILKAFTKIFTIPGIRLGYALCANETLMQNLYFHGADWSVSNLAQAAGIAALKNATDFIKQTVEYISAERRRMEEELAQLGFKVFNAHANYVFFQNSYPFNLRSKLDEKGIRIRSCSNFHRLDDSYYRIAVSTTKNNSKALNAIQVVTESNHLKRKKF